MQPSSRHLAAALCTMQGLQILLCGGKVQPGFVRFAVLLVELRLFGNQFLALGFQLFQVGQFGDFLSLEIGGCRLISCQLGAVLFRKVSGAFAVLACWATFRFWR